MITRAVLSSAKALCVLLATIIEVFCSTNQLYAQETWHQVAIGPFSSNYHGVPQIGTRDLSSNDSNSRLLFHARATVAGGNVQERTVDVTAGGCFDLGNSRFYAINGLWQYSIFSQVCSSRLFCYAGLYGPHPRPITIAHHLGQKVIYVTGETILNDPSPIGDSKDKFLARDFAFNDADCYSMACHGLCARKLRRYLR
jgi:hypothetical protein